MPEREETLSKHFDRLWREAERFIVAYFRHQRHSVMDEASGKKITTYKIENIRDFYYAITCLKRIQEGRITALNLRGGKEDDRNHTGALDVLQKEIFRALEKLPNNGYSESSPEDEM
ncbi:MAG: hypothetical protein N2246_09075 [Candidatus Sumerlaeia bacterium]|nr:hypothetical protein [Candidatus Sumerlaeia bacterium]